MHNSFSIKIHLLEPVEVHRSAALSKRLRVLALECWIRLTCNTNKVNSTYMHAEKVRIWSRFFGAWLASEARYLLTGTCG